MIRGRFAHERLASGGGVAGEQAWTRPTICPTLLDGEVHVWRVEAGRPAASLQRRGIPRPAQEFPTTAGCISPVDDNRHTTLRRALRELLAFYLGRDPAEIALARGPYGKPQIDNPGHVPPLFFNVAHSQSLGLIAIARHHQVGIDLEAVRPGFHWWTIAERFFASHECAHLTSLAEAQRLRAFTLLWTRKEASLKAAGLGLGRGLEELEVSTETDHGARLLRAPAEMLPTSRWNLIDLRLADGYQGCLVVENCRLSLRQWIWPFKSAHEGSQLDRARGLMARSEPG